MPAIATSDVSTALVRFVIARLDDDDAALRRHTERLSPAMAERLRADVLAKRQILGAAQRLLILHDMPQQHDVRSQAIEILRSLATSYADHRAFREEWRMGRKSRVRGSAE